MNRQDIAADGGEWLLGGIAWIVVLFILLLIGIVIWMSILPGLPGEPGSYTLENYTDIFSEGVIFSALLSSIRLTNTDPRENEESIPFHREVYEAIAAPDGGLAEQVMEKLLGDTSRRLGGRLYEA